ncbi:MAG: 1-acyl-sn-glycerol-3-phosphate acyltransferase [Lachnospiraceae bacterium]|nr:1-acyl-sn-glycerol-3-phosphate acyltransferase [Lachnospiraceae bacterium]
MRTILVAIFLILYTIISLPMYLVAFLAGKIDPAKKVVIAQVFVAWGLRCILFISGVKVTVKGKENIPADNNALFVFNHRSFFDIIVGYATAPIPTAFVSKKELEHVPMISWWMRFLNCLFLDRDDIRQGMKTILTGIELMKNGTNIFIAPEGTRNTGEELLPFHEASFKLADKSKKPIIPVAMSNMDEVWEKHMPWVRKTHVIIEYCEPIDMQQMERAEKKKIGETVRGILAEKIAQNAKEL